MYARDGVLRSLAHTKSPVRTHRVLVCGGTTGRWVVCGVVGRDVGWCAVIPPPGVGWCAVWWVEMLGGVRRCTIGYWVVRGDPTRRLTPRAKTTGGAPLRLTPGCAVHGCGWGISLRGALESLEVGDDVSRCVCGVGGNYELGGWVVSKSGESRFWRWCSFWFSTYAMTRGSSPWRMVMAP